ncbi:MAG: Response regulator receiver and and CheY domain [Blastococcus sp.]|jgi:GAF domain-containing protein|nr:Response regulator receiver and and CheY domain [Blastococcus sp.]
MPVDLHAAASSAEAGGHLGEVMGRLARQLQEEHGDVEATLAAITGSAVLTIPGADECGISYVTGRTHVEPRAATGELPRAVDELQQNLGQGPCLDAVWDERIVRMDDASTERRWPEFARAAAGLGVGSMLSFQLFVVGDRLGALNLYSRTARAFDEESQEIGSLFASHAAVALAGAEHEANLLAGMAHRDVIGQAKGILMERFKLTPEQAFGLLTRTSSHTNRKLRDIAENLSETGQLPAG